MNMYEVCAKCGHVGKNCYVEKVFAVKASSGKAAAAFVRGLPRVKHDQSDAILYVTEIDEERYEEIRLRNNNDPYFLCKNIQEQNAWCELEIIPENIKEFPRRKTEEEHKITYYGKQILRNPKRYINNYLNEQEYSA